MCNNIYCVWFNALRYLVIMHVVRAALHVASNWCANSNYKLTIYLQKAVLKADLHRKRKIEYTNSYGSTHKNA